MDKKSILSISLEKLKLQYNIIFYCLLDDMPKEKRLSLLVEEKKIDKECTRIKKKLGIFTKDPCSVMKGSPDKCYRCKYYEKHLCNMKKNMHENNGTFRGYKLRIANA